MTMDELLQMDQYDSQGKLVYRKRKASMHTK